MNKENEEQAAGMKGKGLLVPEGVMLTPTVRI